MSAVIQRAVARPPQAWTEYLLSAPGEPEVWGEKKHAHIFKTHAVADEIAGRLRAEARAHNLAAGRIELAFIHARTVENYEWNDFKPGEPKPPIAVTGADIKVRMDPKRMAEVLRDPVESYG